ncbi:MAG TPA: hypothetical protein VL084_15375 [Thermoanaerobaculia bacterium]|nr:hypothetical protein [Thermoanaerobaculia bacterium]
MISSDGAEVVSVSLAFLVQGRFEAAMLPTNDLLPVPAFHSHYGLFPSLVPLPFLAPVWPLRTLVGASAVDAAAALTWLTGAALAALGFLRVARSLRPGTSAIWAPAFLAGTFLWPYAADSFFDPWSAAAFAFAAAQLLSTAKLRPADLLASGLLWSAGCWLRPILWVTAPIPVLAVALRTRREAGSARTLLPLGFGLLAGLAVALAVNRLNQGAFLDFGYALSPSLPFRSGLLHGLLGQTVLPGRGILLYAPLLVAALAGLRRLRVDAMVLLAGPLVVLLLVISRWYIWYGGSCWGPRYLLAALPLAAAPAVLVTRRLTVPLLLAGAAVNLLGVAVAPGAWISYAERLPVPEGAAWPQAGPDRVSEVAGLSPVSGHLWLLAENVRPGFLNAPAIYTSSAPPPKPEVFISPWVLRRLLRLPPLSPLVPRLLTRTAAAYAYRGRPEQAARFAREALLLDPLQAEARELLAPRETPSPQPPGSDSRPRSVP